MANINVKNFPGVYTQIIDQSFLPTSTSRFQPGLIGVASKGPFDTPVRIATVQDFINTFGQPITGPYFLSTALGVIAPFSNGSTIVRVGGQYKPLPGNTSYPASGASGNNYFICQGAPIINPGLSPTGNVFVEITQDSKQSTINAQVLSINGSYGTLIPGDTLADTYTNGVLKFSYYANAASKAEGRLDGYVYQTVNLGAVSGTRGNFFMNVTATPTNVSAGDLLIITQNNKAPTQEVYVSQVNPLVGGSAVIQFQQTSDAERGYQALPLQDNYTSASVSRVVAKTPAALIYALTEGTWANTESDSPTGLQVQVGPGTNAGTKKLSVFWNSALVEVFDNLGFFTTPSGATDFEEQINTLTPSNYITIQTLGTVVPANTVNPWNLSPSLPIVGAPTNDAQPGDAGSFAGGFNGENAQAADFIGAYDPNSDAMTGIKAFEDTDNVFINVLCAPGVTSTDATTVGVHTQIRDTATKTNAIGLIDIPQNNPQTFPLSNVASVPLNIWNAIDWSNGAGQFIARGKFDTRYLACFFNWFTMQDPITQSTIVAPPTIGALRTMAFTWLNDQPWYAAAGPNRGVINEATAVSWPKLSSNAKEAATAPGNVVNLILQSQGEIMVYGERTMQRASSKLTAIHNLVLVEYVVQGLAAIGRQRVFDPNDLTLLQQLNLAMTQFLDSVKNLRGIEAYQLVCDSSNNNATTRNLREVIVDLFIVPTDAVEKIYINATVLESGAIVNNVTG